ncbi:MAG: selenide, water dikinase SelD [Clostridia bacterium]
MGPGALSEILSKLPKARDENLLVGFDRSDDAAAYRISEDMALIQTVDFFPPMVDDPFLFGQIAAANAISDIYAMGAVPKLAMNLLCVPSCLGADVIGEILRGGCEKALEAGVTIAGGHTITDSEPKYGLCVTGFARPHEIWTTAGAREGDAIIRTKPLGTGILATAARGELLAEDGVDAMIDSMTRLNRAARDAIVARHPSALTDVTGFGLIGHASEMARASGVTIAIDSARVPLLPYALEFAQKEVVPGGAYRNQAYFSPTTRVADAVSAALAIVLSNPETSGGLLAAIPETEVAALLLAYGQACVIGKVHRKQAQDIIVS